MNPIKIEIAGEFLDSYLYSGYLFIIKKSGEFGAILLKKLFYENLPDKIPSYRKKFITNIFLRNDWFTNPQGLALLNNPDFKEVLKDLWNNLNYKIIFEIENDSFIHLGEIGDLNIYDLRFYANTCVFSNRDGLFGYNLYFDRSSDIFISAKNKLSDARIIHINPKSGVLMLSAGNDGLLLGQFYRNLDDSIYVNVPDRVYEKKSIKTGWFNYDSINYESKYKITYLKNVWEKTEKRNYFYSQTDETNEKRELKFFSREKFELNNEIDNSRFYFNTNGKIFSIKNNKVSMEYIKYNIDNKNIDRKDSNYNIDLEDLLNSDATIINAFQLPNGLILEYINEVFFAMNGNLYKLEEEEVFSIRTFLSSRRYKRIISINKPNSISLYATFPEQYHAV